MNDFGSTTTTDEVLEGIDLTGRRIVITGAASGLGLESARALAAHGATVTVLARSDERAAGAKDQVDALVPGTSVEYGVVDLGELASIRRFADTYLETHDAIDVLINNAGVMACPFGRTADGFETQFGTNHLGHFLLTALLSPAILAGHHPLRAGEDGQRAVRTGTGPPGRATGAALLLGAPRRHHDRARSPPRRSAHERDDRVLAHP